VVVSSGTDFIQLTINNTVTNITAEFFNNQTGINTDYNVAVPISLTNPTSVWQLLAQAFAGSVGVAAGSPLFGINHNPTLATFVFKASVLSSGSFVFQIPFAPHATDPDLPYGDSISLSNGASPLTTWKITSANGGSITFLSATVASYTAPANFNGIDTFVIFVVDARGGHTSNTISVSVTNPVITCTTTVLQVIKSKAHPATITPANLGCPTSITSIASVTNQSPSKSSTSLSSGSIKLTASPNRSGTFLFSYGVLNSVGQTISFSGDVNVTNHAPIFLSGNSSLWFNHVHGANWGASYPLNSVYDQDGDTTSIISIAGVTPGAVQSGNFQVNYPALNAAFIVTSPGTLNFRTQTNGELPFNIALNLQISFIVSDGDVDNPGLLHGTFTLTSS